MSAQDDFQSGAFIWKGCLAIAAVLLLVGFIIASLIRAWL